jgi:hypothetical protein
MVRAFGPDIFMLLPGKTKSTVEGLLATDVFDNWYIDNKEIADSYKNVYAYFAPEGGEFDFQAYLRQIRTGQRVRYTDSNELRADAEAIVGRALYMEAVSTFGPELNEGERQYLGSYRRQLEEQYPGFAGQTIDVNRRKRLFEDLTAMANDERMADNEIAQGIAEYMKKRDDVIALAIQRDGTYSDKILERQGNADLRAYLREVGTRLMQDYPMFGRVYSRVLFDEITEG